MAARKTSNTAPAAAAEEKENGMKFTSSGKEQDREVLFSIDDKDFTVPVKPPMNVTLKFINEYRKTGNEMAAALGLVESLLGEEGYAALLDWDELTDEIFEQIMDACTKKALGRAEEATKN